MPSCVILRRSLFVALALLAGRSMHAQTARVTGLVTDSAGGRPLPGVEVVLMGEGERVQRAARTGADGRYVLVNLPAGEARLRARMLGFAPREQRLTLTDGASATADFALALRATQLDQVVVTGTGGAVERRSVGNVVETINAEEVLARAAPRSVEQLIGARTPGVVVLPSTGQVGTGAQLRVRSVGSLSLNSDPIVYIDGVRMDASAARGPVQRGGAGVSRLNDINPEDIESIEIIKGPAAATLYGTEASNGVIQILTKHGKTGKPLWNFSARRGTNWLQNPEGRSGLLWAKDASGQLTSFNLYRRELDQGHGPIFTNGELQGYAVNLSGGTDATRYYLSSSWDDDVGVVPWNWDKKFGGRANVEIQASDRLRIQGNLGYVRDRIRLAQPGEINPDPFSNLVWGRMSNIPTTGGFGFAPRALWDDVENHADNDRMTTGLMLQYEPATWFSNRLTAGLDVSAENNWTLYPRETPANAGFYGSNGLGSKNVDRVFRRYLTLDYAGNLKYSFLLPVDFTTSVGFQHYRAEVSDVLAGGTTFPASPITTISGTTTRTATEGDSANATVGVFVQQQAAWLNRRFLTAALRADNNSAFGKSYSAAYYPKVSASWVVSEEPFWSDRLPFVANVIGDLRLRGAYGAAGTQPGTFDAARLYASVVGSQNQPGLVPGSFGNPQLRPERSTELELGLETTMLDRRLDISYTNFRRRITDEIVNVPLSPSIGFPGSQVLNIGRVRAWGNELGANMHILRGARVAWDLGTQFSNNGNEIQNMGGQQFLTVGGGGQAQNRVGFAIADFFMYRVRSAVLDANGNVLSAVCDGGRGKSGLEPGGPDRPCPIGTYTGTPAPRVFWGHSQPTWQVGLNSQVTLWQNFRLYARVDGNGGHLQSNTEIRALHNQGSTKAVILRNDPFLQTYRAIEADAPGTYKAGFLKLREVSATYMAPPSIARRAGASAASISVAGRNLSTLWTAQNGWKTSRDGEVYVDVADQHVWDPEIRAIGSRANGYQTILPPTASFTTTVRLTF